MKIGIYGGAFNPPHLGHLIITNFILNEFQLDYIYFIPSYLSDYKKINVDESTRLKMLQLTLKNNNKFILNKTEIESKQISYTIDTLKKICDSKHKYYLIMGNEWLDRFNTWKNYKEIFKYCSLIVAKRVNQKMQIPKFLNQFKKKIFFSSNPFIEISSSKIQEMLKNNLDIRYFVVPEVYRFIKAKGTVLFF